MDGRLFSGDEIVAVDGHSVLGASHHVVVEMMGSAAQRGQVQLTIRRRQGQFSFLQVFRKTARYLFSLVFISDFVNMLICPRAKWSFLGIKDC